MILRHFIERAASAIGIKPAPSSYFDFALSHDQVQALKNRPPNDIAKAFFECTERPAQKWAHYFDIYHSHFVRFRDRPIFFLEIGVMDGGSLDMWRKYFGPSATIVGIDINAECAKRVEPPNIVKIGSQDDPKFLQEIVQEFGPPDIVLDDGSHIGCHQRTSFDFLFPLLKAGGLYAIEDTHTSYWAGWEGGYRRRGTIIEYVKPMIDDLHWWYHKKQSVAEVGAIHVYDSIVVLEKATKQKPGFLYSNR
jgi:hypothetical protein